MVENRGSSSGKAGGRGMGWLPWLLGALIVLGGLTAIDLAFYRDDIHDEAHEESESHTEETGDETDTGTNLVEPRDEDADTSDSDH